MEKAITLKFDAAYDVFQFLLKTIDDNIGEGENAYAYVSHLVSPFFASKNDFKTIKRIEKKGKVHYICRSDSPFDQILSKFYEGFNSKVKLGIKLSFDGDIYAVHDLIIKVKVKEDFIKELDDLYFDTKSILSFNMMRFVKDFALKKVDFDITIEKNKKLANKIKEDLSGYFL